MYPTANIPIWASYVLHMVSYGRTYEAHYVNIVICILYMMLLLELIIKRRPWFLNQVLYRSTVNSYYHLKDWYLHPRCSCVSLAHNNIIWFTLINVLLACLYFMHHICNCISRWCYHISPYCDCLLVLVTWYASVAKWLPSRNWNGDVHRIPVGIIYWLDVSRGSGVSSVYFLQ